MGNCRLAVHGDSTKATEWISLLARPGDLIQVGGRSHLLAGGRRGLVLAEAKTAEVDTETPPVTVRVSRPVRRHPHARLVLTPLKPRRAAGVSSGVASPVFALETDGSICGANRWFAEAVGRTLDKIMGVHYSVLLGPASSGSGDPITQSLADGKARSEKAEYTGFSEFPQVRVRPLLRAKGRVGALLVRLEPLAARGSRQKTARF